MRSRLRQLSLLWRLGQEAGGGHAASLVLMSGLGSLLDIAGLGLGVSVLVGAAPAGALPLPWRQTLAQSLVLLVLLVLVRSGLQALIAVGQEQLRSGFTDRLRRQLLSQVLHAPSLKLEQLGRGELIGLLMADISRSVHALDQGLRALLALLSLALYLGGVLLVGRQAALPLLLALAATAAAGLLRRSGSWQLGRLQTRLNSSIQRSVGDGLHGLKAVRAAAAETWLLQRFAHDTQLFRQVLRQTVRRQALFTALRDTLVVMGVVLWLLLGRRDLQPAQVATTLLLAYRSGTALSAVISAQRLCLGSLTGYEELCRRRTLLSPPDELPQGQIIPLGRLEDLACLDRWQALCWHSPTAPVTAHGLELQPGCLVAVVGPSGCGKTTLLDAFCGLLGEQRSLWILRTVDPVSTLKLSGPAGARQLRQWIAYAPQSAVLFEASLRHNLLFDRVQPTAILHDWLGRLGLEHLLDRTGGLDEPLPLAVDHFSGGEIQRLGLLRAWLRDRPVEVLDEPTAFLDADAAARVRALVRERSRHRLVLVSTHDPALIRLADRVVRLQQSDRQRAQSQHHSG